MAEHQCPACLDPMDTPKKAPVALRCGHIICGSCLSKTTHTPGMNHVCGICRAECAPRHVYRVYLPELVNTSAPTPPSSDMASSTSDSLIQRADAIVAAAPRLGAESTSQEIESFLVPAEQWYIAADSQAHTHAAGNLVRCPPRETMDTVLSCLESVRQTLTDTRELEDLRQRDHFATLERHMMHNQITDYDNRLRTAQGKLKQARGENTRLEELVKQAEDSRYLGFIKAEGAESALKSCLKVLQQTLQSETQRKLKYKQMYRSLRRSSQKGKRRMHYCSDSDDVSDELSSTSSADEAEVSQAFSVPTPALPSTSEQPPVSHTPTSPRHQGSCDDDANAVVYGPPPSQPIHSLKRKRRLSDASDSTSTSTEGDLPPLDPDEQAAREEAAAQRFSKRLRIAREQGVNEGWVPRDWLARVVLGDRKKQAREERAQRKKSRESREGASTNGQAAASRPMAGSSRIGAIANQVLSWIV